ncbi:MAG: MBL fold metallo-hydrolase [Candidatus Nanohalobium sp.]
MKLNFLGTGGGRFVTGMQRRKTGGIVVETEETQVHVDPGPGALVETHENAAPEQTEAVIVSHAHLDHCNDVEPIIEMMTEAYGNPGAVYANRTAMEGYGDIEKAVSEYHKNLCLKTETLEENSEYKFKDLKIESQEMFHNDPKTQGLKLSTEEKTVGFWTDTEFSEELLPFYEECDTLVIYCVRPRNKGLSGHISLDEVPKIVEATEAKTVILTHFGSKFLDSGMEEEENWLEEQVEAKIIFAEDGMKFPGNRKLGDF